MARIPLPSLPKPKSFLYYMSLRTGTELILLTVLVNKVSGLYGLLAPLTGFGLSPLQLSMYVYSLAALVATIFLARAMRRSSPAASSTPPSQYPHHQDLRLAEKEAPSPFAALAFAHLYVADSLINAAYTAAFGVAWFHLAAADPGGSPFSGTVMDEAGGFTSPEVNASRVDIVASPAAGMKAGQDAVAEPKFIANGNTGSGTASEALLQPGGIASLAIVCGLWAVRVYFVLVALAYARQVLQTHRNAAITDSSSSASSFSAPSFVTPDATPDLSGPSTFATKQDSAASAPDDPSDNPFAPYRPAGRGRTGALARAMLRLAPGYWLGPESDEEWARGVGARFGGIRRPRSPGPVGPGVVERERRRRSGTGPPAPVELPRFVGA